MELHFTPRSRAKVVAYIVIAIMAIFVVQLFYIQVLQHGYYQEQADSAQIKQRELSAKKG